MGWQAIATAATQAGSGIGVPILGAYANARQSQLQRRWNEKMFDWERQASAQAADIAWDRSTDYKYLMQRYREAGINPNQVVGSSQSAPMASSSHVNGYQQADMSALSRIDFSNVMQSIANLDKTNAEKNYINAQSSNINFNQRMDMLYKPLEYTISRELADQTISNGKATNANLQEMNNLIGQQLTNAKTENESMQLKNIFQDINNKFQYRLNQLEVESRTVQNSESRSRISKIANEIMQINASVEEIKTKVTLNKQQFTTNIGIQRKLTAEIGEIWERAGLHSDYSLSERLLRPYKTRNAKYEPYFKSANLGLDAIKKFVK